MASQRWYIIYYDTPQILALIQQPSPINNRFLRIKKHELEELSLQMLTWKKDSKYSFKQNIFNFPNFLQHNFIKDEIFEEETLSSKNTAKLKDLPCQNKVVVDFLFLIKFFIKIILTTTEYCNLQ